MNCLYSARSRCSCTSDRFFSGTTAANKQPDNKRIESDCKIASKRCVRSRHSETKQAPTSHSSQQERLRQLCAWTADRCRCFPRQRLVLSARLCSPQRQRRCQMQIPTCSRSARAQKKKTQGRSSRRGHTNKRADAQKGKLTCSESAYSLSLPSSLSPGTGAVPLRAINRVEDRR